MSSGRGKPRLLLVVLLVVLLALLSTVPTRMAAAAGAVPLLTGWKLQSGCVVKSTGERISSPDYRPAGWIDAIVPGTVLGSQVAAGMFPDPFAKSQERITRQGKFSATCR